MFSFIPSFVANGTIMWGRYDPAAPFYGWDFFTVALTVFAFASIIWFVLETLENIHNNPPKLLNKNLLITIVFAWAGNLWGYASAASYLDYTGQRHAVIPVFIIWLTVFILPALTWYKFGEKTCLS